jgi:hypothetical protein
MTLSACQKKTSEVFKILDATNLQCRLPADRTGRLCLFPRVWMHSGLCRKLFRGMSEFSIKIDLFTKYLFFR